MRLDPFATLRSLRGDGLIFRPVSVRRHRTRPAGGNAVAGGIRFLSPIQLSNREHQGEIR